MLYVNRIIKLISPFSFQAFKVELNGEEDELRELIATILEINPNSIKGIRDSYNNYYTLSSAIKNPHINTNPNNYYTIVIKDSNQNNINNRNSLPLKSPNYNYNLLKNDRIYSLPNENNINYHTNYLNNTYNFFEDNNNYNQKNINMNNYNYSYNDMNQKNDLGEFLNFADDLYKNNYIDNNLTKKLKRLILENNKEVLSIMSPYIILKSPKSYNEFTKKIIPIISHRSKFSENNEDSYIISSENDNKSKKLKLFQNDKILDDIKQNVTKKEYKKLKKLLKNEDKNLMKIIKNFQKNNNFSKLLSKLKKIVNSEEDDNSQNTEKTNEKNISKSKNEYNEKDIKKIEKNIINSLKDKKAIDVYYIAKYDFQKLNKEKKISLFKKKFNLKLESIINKENYKIPKKNISTIKEYYIEYINKKIKKNFDESENIIYEGLLEQEEEDNFLLKYYKDLLKHKNINQLRNQIKQIIKATVERIQDEEGEEEEDDEDGEEEDKEKNNNEGKTLIKEENEEEEEEEDDEDEEGEEEDEKDSKDEDNKSSSNKTSENIIILKDDNKDRAVNILNNNYRKINNYNYNINDNANNNDKNKKEENNDKKDDQNLGLGFVVVKPKKSNAEENNVNILKLNTSESNKQNESSFSTNNPNKKLNQFIQQIEHLKKIDDIKEEILQAIKNNNKYIMDLFQKFQKNKFCLNPKSLIAVYKQIKENPEIDTKGQEFKALIKEIPSINENIIEFLCYEFINNKNSELETHYNIYVDNKEKDEFIESIEMFMKKPATKKLLNKFNIKNVKKEILPKLSETNDNLIENSKELLKIFEKYNIFSENEFNIIKNSLENGNNIFTATFQVLFDNKDFDEFYETITIALDNQINKGGNKK